MDHSASRPHVILMSVLAAIVAVVCFVAVLSPDGGNGPFILDPHQRNDVNHIQPYYKHVHPYVALHCYRFISFQGEDIGEMCFKRYINPTRLEGKINERAINVNWVFVNYLGCANGVRSKCKKSLH